MFIEYRLCCYGNYAPVYNVSSTLPSEISNNPIKGTPAFKVAIVPQESRRDSFMDIGCEAWADHTPNRARNIN
jgi:hypothetical protein